MLSSGAVDSRKKQQVSLRLLSKPGSIGKSEEDLCGGSRDGGSPVMGRSKVEARVLSGLSHASKRVQIG